MKERRDRKKEGEKGKETDRGEEKMQKDVI